MARSLTIPAKSLATLIVALLMIGLVPTAALAKDVTALAWSGTGLVTADGTHYAKGGGALVLTATVSTGTACVTFSGGHLSAPVEDKAAPFELSFSATATGDGVQTYTAKGWGNSNCSTQGGAQLSSSFTLDNTAPTVSGTRNPAANGGGWNNSDVTVDWAATDTGGSGVTTGPAPASDSQTAETTAAGVIKTAQATDRVGNVGTGSIVVKLDKTLPTITGSRLPAANTAGWNNTNVTVSFECSDTASGIASCPASVLLNSTGEHEPVTRSATDNADNTKSATVSDIKIDKVPPTLTGAASTEPNTNGWYNGDVTIEWEAGDLHSGVAATPQDSKIEGEGNNLSASETVSDHAGNSTTTGVGGIKIDRTKPTTTISPNGDWRKTEAVVTLTATDGLSDVATTYYQIGEREEQQYTDAFTLQEGVHTVTFWSVDKAGNAEDAKTAQIRVDKTDPVITHALSPLANGLGWNNAAVTVTFTCSDANGSGIKSCTDAQTVDQEADDHEVIGSAEDNAGNAASDTAVVKLDETKPTISVAADREPNANGWYKGDVTATFTCDDALSGVVSCPAAHPFAQGEDQSRTGTVDDAAGNSDTATISNIDVDKTKPVLTGTASATNWTNDDVIVTWECSDALSGLASGDAGSCSTPTRVTGEGSDLSATHSVTDNADNSQTTIVDGIKIDRARPTTTLSLDRSPSNAGNWHDGPVTVTLTGTDSLSDVQHTYYKVNGGQTRTYSTPFTHSVGGISTITFWSVDNAGNVEDNTVTVNTVEVKIDNIDPSITGSRTPTANDFGWNNGDVTVSFTCTDDETGVPQGKCSGGATVQTQGENQSVIGTAEDAAGNNKQATVGNINIDLTKPTVTGDATTQANANGWYKGDVTIAWTATDALSGIDPATAPANSPITGEGADLGAGPVTATDKAGNVSLGASKTGIKIDRTAPTTALSLDRQPVSDNWYSAPVTVTLTADDALSTVDKVYYSINGGDVKDYDRPFQHGATGQSTINFWSVDKAGNVEDKTLVSRSVTIYIDDVKPTIQGTRAPGVNAFGWNNESVAVTFTCDDRHSGVAEGKCTGNKTLDEQGADQSVTGTAEDRVGNVETATVDDINIDLTKPTASGAATAEPNVHGWYNDDVTIKWGGRDELSGVDQDSVPANTVISDDGDDLAAGPVTVKDKAGNTSDEVSVSQIKIDRKRPTLSGAPTTQANANGWYRGDVTIAWTAKDTLSGIDQDTAPADGVIRGEGENLGAGPVTVKDKAGNTSDEASVSEIKIDRTAPRVAVVGIVNDQYTTGAEPTVACNATDELSGLDGAVTPKRVQAQDATGTTVTYTCTAMDKAGNTQSSDKSYRLVAPVVNLAPVYRADALIKKQGEKTFAGDNRYNTTGYLQTKSVKATRGATRSFSIRMQNDGNAADAFKLIGCASTTGVKVAYYAGNTLVTTKVVNGTFKTASLAPGAFRTVTAVYTVTSKAKIGSVRACALTVTSTKSTKADTVKARVEVIE